MLHCSYTGDIHLLQKNFVIIATKEIINTIIIQFNPKYTIAIKNPKNNSWRFAKLITVPTYVLSQWYKNDVGLKNGVEKNLLKEWQPYKAKKKKTVVDTDIILVHKTKGISILCIRQFGEDESIHYGDYITSEKFK